MKLKALVFTFTFVSTVALQAPAASDYCPSEFARLGQVVDYTHEVRRLARQATYSTISIHDFEGRKVLDVGYIHNGDLDLVRLIPAGVRAGAWDEIAIGAMVGPKAPAYFARMIESSAPGKEIRFTGWIEPRKIIAEQKEEKALRVKPKTESGAQEPLYWGKREVREFRAALESLRLKQACLNLYGSAVLETCGPLRFEIIPQTGTYRFSRPPEKKEFSLD